MIFTKSLLALASLPMAALLAATTPAHADKFTFRVASGHSPSWHFVALTKDFFIPEVRKRVAERTEHEVEFIEGWSGAMAKPTEVLEAVEAGIVDMGMFCICHEGQKLSLHNFPYYLPFGPSDPEIVIKATRDVYNAHPELNDVFGRYGQRVLSLVPFEPYDFVSRFPIAKADDVRGRKVGAAGPNAFWVERAGALPVSVGGPDMYTSFQTGLIDAMLIFPSVMDSLKLYEVAPHLVRVEFGSMAVTPLTINNRRFERLPQEVQDIIVEVGQEMEAMAGAHTRDLVSNVVNQLESKGVKTSSVSPEERRNWLEMLADEAVAVADKFEAESNLPVKQVMKTYIEATETHGHEWPMKLNLD